MTQLSQSTSRGHLRPWIHISVWSSHGHTGIVIEDSDGVTMRTIEQNIDGNADSLYVGGPMIQYTPILMGLLDGSISQLTTHLWHLNSQNHQNH